MKVVVEGLPVMEVMLLLRMVELYHGSLVRTDSEGLPPDDDVQELVNGLPEYWALAALRALAGKLEVA